MNRVLVRIVLLTSKRPVLPLASVLRDLPVKASTKNNIACIDPFRIVKQYPASPVTVNFLIRLIRLNHSFDSFDSTANSMCFLSQSITHQSVRSHSDRDASDAVMPC